MSQRTRILEYLQNNKSITPIDALKEIGCFRLAARIWDLKHLEGHNIKSITECSTNRNGEKKHYSRYILMDNEKELTCTCDTDKSTDVSKLG